MNVKSSWIRSFRRCVNLRMSAKAFKPTIHRKLHLRIAVQCLVSLVSSRKQAIQQRVASTTIQIRTRATSCTSRTSRTSKWSLVPSPTMATRRATTSRTPSCSTKWSVSTTNYADHCLNPTDFQAPTPMSGIFYGAPHLANHKKWEKEQPNQQGWQRHENSENHVSSLIASYWR